MIRGYKIQIMIEVVHPGLTDIRSGPTGVFSCYHCFNCYILARENRHFQIVKIFTVTVSWTEPKYHSFWRE
jgi:hypothetical protein